MRQLFLIFLVLCTGIDLLGQDLSADYHKDHQNLHGRVQSMTETSFMAKQENGKIVKGKLLGHDSFTYNEEGYLLEATHSNAAGLLWRDVNAYDVQGLRIEEHRTNAEGDLVYKNTYQYDLQGNQIEKTAFDHRGKPQFRINRTFNGNGDVLMVKRTSVSIPGQSQTIVENIYDEKGRLIEERMNDLTGPVKILNSYDNKGNKVETHLYESKKKLIERQTFAFDEKGRMMENAIYEGSEVSGDKIVYAYDERGNLTEKSHYKKDGQLLERETHQFAYDTLDQLMMERHGKYYQGTDESVEMSEYDDFDQNGNWRSNSISKNGSPETIIERKITYYEASE